MNQQLKPSNWWFVCQGKNSYAEWDKALHGNATNCSYCWPAGNLTARPPDLNHVFKEHFPASSGPETKLFPCTSSQVGRILHSAGCHRINPDNAIHAALVSWTAKWVIDSLRKEFCNPSEKALLAMKICLPILGIWSCGKIRLTVWSLEEKTL